MFPLVWSVIKWVVEISLSCGLAYLRCVIVQPVLYFSRRCYVCREAMMHVFFNVFAAALKCFKFLLFFLDGSFGVFFPLIRFLFKKKKKKN